MQGDHSLRRYPTAPNTARKALWYDCPPASPLKRPNFWMFQLAGLRFKHVFETA